MKNSFKWFDTSKKPYSVKIDFALMDLFIKHFNTNSTRADVNKDLSHHSIDSTLSKKLEF